MSFENKGFPNSLNSRYDSMNDQPTNYNTQKLNTGTIKLNPVGLPDYNNYMVSPSAISGLYSNIKSGKIKSGEGKEKVKEAANNIADFFSNLFKGDEEKKEARKEKRSDRKEKRKARRYKRKGNKIVKVDDDGEETGEVVTNAAELKKDLLVILNDNEMGICPRVGGLAKYLDKARTADFYNGLKRDVNWLLNKVPMVGKPSADAIAQFKDALKGFLHGGKLFEDMGFRYIGPVCLLYTSPSPRDS